jgi:hypothetical protein
MVYKHLTDERKEHIDKVVKSLKSKYSTASGIDFQSLARDLDIKFLVTGKLAAGVRVESDGRNYVLVAKRFMPSVRKYSASHEFGHAILRHGSSPPIESKEQDEANYFAERLTGISFRRYSWLLPLDLFLFALAHPFTAMNYVINLSKGNLLTGDAKKLIIELGCK